MDSLANFNFALNFDGGLTFGNADIATPTANVLVLISTVGNDFSLNFGGSGGGPFDGSLDFVNADGALSFEPDGGLLYFSTNISGLGTYEAISPVPEPLTLLGASAAIAFGAAFKRRKAQ